MELRISQNLEFDGILCISEDPVLKGLDLLVCVQLVNAHIKALGCFGQLTEGSDPTKQRESKQFLSKIFGIESHVSNF